MTNQTPKQAVKIFRDIVLPQINCLRKEEVTKQKRVLWNSLKNYASKGGGEIEEGTEKHKFHFVSSRKPCTVSLYLDGGESELDLSVGAEYDFKLMTWDGNDVFEAIMQPQEYQIKKAIYGRSGAFGTDHYDHAGEHVLSYVLANCSKSVNASQFKSEMENTLGIFFTTYKGNGRDFSNVDFKMAKPEWFIDEHAFFGAIARKPADQKKVDKRLGQAAISWLEKIENLLKKQQEARQKAFVTNLVWIAGAFIFLFWLVS